VSSILIQRASSYNYLSVDSIKVIKANLRNKIPIEKNGGLETTGTGPLRVREEGGEASIN
jgi:hypothetical protein